MANGQLHTQDQVLYIDEIRKGNYTIFIKHVLDQIPSAFKISSLDLKFLNDYRDYLLSINDELAETYCTIMSTTNNDFFKGSECVGAIREYWRDFITNVDKDEYWVRMGIHMLKLFSTNVGVAAIIALPIQLASLAVSRIEKDKKLEDQVIITLSKLSTLTAAFYAEILVHLLTESVGTPINAFMILAGNVVNELMKTYG
ncbi:hypothetical protein [Vulcanisaeta sp. JCM 14467]|uniref:hypothetical protein n=1 Tax=Vulcanisaeta sp. JCM 14467 TaxID=1295370 RepID=UPI0006D08D66|nr:hypothetical protein [Vulcanisaeta sp. JCM 14467]